MTRDINSIALLLFVPADRLVRFGKAVSAQPDAVIIDLEDAFAEAARDNARARLGTVLTEMTCGLPVLLRINAVGTAWHDDDLRAARDLRLVTVILPKAERAEDVGQAANRSGHPVLALVETARGAAEAETLDRTARRFAFGSIDYAADLSMGHTRLSLLHARSRIVLASRLVGLPGPIDGVTTAIHNRDAIFSDRAHAVEMGFTGKLLNHPAQIAPRGKGSCRQRRKRLGQRGLSRLCWGRRGPIGG